MTSYHEAAPMVIDEARCLGLPVLTTATTSSKDMVVDMACGWVCENSQEALNEALYNVVADKEALYELKRELLNRTADNSKAIEQFRSLMDG